MATAASRRPRWRHHAPPPPTPRILHFPRRRPSSRRDLKSNTTNRLWALIDRERRARVPIVVLDNNNNSSEGERRRERVESRSQSPKGWALEEEKWKFQAEMLRAECNLLRMEKEIAVKKLERTRVQMETTLRSALHTLVSVSAPSLFPTPYSLIVFISTLTKRSYNMIKAVCDEVFPNLAPGNVFFQLCYDFVCLIYAAIFNVYCPKF